MSRADPQPHHPCSASAYSQPAHVHAYPGDHPVLIRSAAENDAPGYNPERRVAVMSRHAVDPSPFTLLWAGRVGRDRNIEFLLDRFRDVRKRSADIQLVFAGDGPALEHYRRLSAAMAGVHWLGELSVVDHQDWHSAADLLISPGLMGGSSDVVLAAQAAGLPAIVTDIGESRNIIRNGDTGYVLSPADPKAWTQHICTLMHSKLANPAGWTRKRYEISRSAAATSSTANSLSTAR